MADAVADSLLRKQLIELGADNVGPINQGNRYLYIKKLNHLRARRRSSLSLGKSSRGLSGFSSDEDGLSERQRGSPASEKRRPKKTPNRRKSQVPVSVSTPSASHSQGNGSALSSSLARPRLRSRASVKNGVDADYSLNETIEHQPQMQSFTAQTSFTSDNSLFNDSSMRCVDENNGGDASFAPTTSWNSGESSDSDVKDVRHNHNNSRHRKQRKSAVLPLTSCNLDRKYSSLRYSQKEHQAAPEVVPPKHPFISMLLLVFMVLFFVSLAAFYFNIAASSSASETESQTPNYMFCPDGKTTSLDCFQRHEVESVLPIIHHLADHLSQLLGQHECGSVVSSPNLTVSECMAVMNTHFENIGESSCSERRMEVALRLFIANPEWNVQLLDEWGAVVVKDSDYKKVAQVRSIDPSMSTQCRLMKSLNEIMQYVLISCALVLALSSLVACVKYYWKRKEEETKQLYELVEQVLDKVRNHHDAYLKAQEDGRKDILPYIAITHVRDMLIAPQERKMKRQIWNKAVKFIDASESRIRVEEQNIEDEEFKVWRWLQNTANGRKRKVWQGQAFGAKESANMPAFRPTQCLKIRNMFDAEVEFGDDWHVHVQDAILEKCGPNHGIVHMAVDKTSKEGCVFVMCSSSEASGRAFHALHGWWFDGILITVKFLRLERYYERFPDVVGCHIPLWPSNKEQRSLSVPFHQSITESS